MTSSRTLLFTACVGSLLAGSTVASALDTELQGGGLGLGVDRKDYEFVLGTELQSKQVDQGIVRNEDATQRFAGHGRFWGLGVSLDAQMALGEDKGAGYLTKVEPTTYGSRPTKPLETTQVEIKVDYLLEIGGVYGDNEPFIQFIPHFDTIIYPNQPAGPLKDSQKYLGADLWWATPLKGVELGTSQDWSVGNQPAYRGAVGLREFYQAAPYDLAFWQVANWGDKNYHNLFTGSEQGGLTTIDLGAKVTTNLLWRETWAYLRADWSYWMTKGDRDQLDLIGQDVGQLQFAIGVEWRAE